MMTRRPVDSSNVEHVGYDPDTRTMEVKYKSGGTYHYHDVPPAEHAKLISAPSIGKHIAQNVRGIYASTKVKDEA